MTKFVENITKTIFNVFSRFTAYMPIFYMDRTMWAGSDGAADIRVHYDAA